MSLQVHSIQIEVDEWPQRNDLAEFQQTPDRKEQIRAFLTQEFDSLVSFQIGETNLLSGFKEAYFHPVHAFLQNLSSGLKILGSIGNAVVPVYLQQYSITPGSPCHKIFFQLEGDRVQVRFEWGGEQAAPKALADFKEGWVTYGHLQTAIAESVETYYRKMARLLGHLNEWSGEDISLLFKDF